jgi:hypothetical protein
MSGRSEGRDVFIRGILDVCGALTDETLGGYLRLFDNNRSLGSTGWGGRDLATSVTRGDRVRWWLTPIECEAYFTLDAIVFSGCEFAPVRRFHEASRAYLWTLDVGEAPFTDAPYEMLLTLGNGVRVSNGTRTRLVWTGEGAA